MSHQCRSYRYRHQHWLLADNVLARTRKQFKLLALFCSVCGVKQRGLFVVNVDEVINVLGLNVTPQGATPLEEAINDLQAAVNEFNGTDLSDANIDSARITDAILVIFATNGSAIFNHNTCL